MGVDDGYRLKWPGERAALKSKLQAPSLNAVMMHKFEVNFYIFSLIPALCCLDSLRTNNANLILFSLSKTRNTFHSSPSATVPRRCQTAMPICLRYR